MTVGRDLSMMRKVTRVGILFDFYGALLTDRQREMIELHYFDDWSLAEIAEHFSVSRQAVHDNLRRAEEQLASYENALQLLASHESHRELLRAVMTEWDAVSDSVPETDRHKIRALLEALLQEFQPPASGLS